jgi:uncharacterized membrane protein YozB (DUF420 family)
LAIAEDSSGGENQDRGPDSGTRHATDRRLGPVPREEPPVLTAGNVILGLKIAVAAVTVLLLTSLFAILSGRRRLHGRLNLVFFALTIAALVLFEAVIRLVKPGLFAEMKANADLWQRLTIHLCFSIPSAVLLPVMLFTGLKRRRWLHLLLAGVFSVLWTGTFITGVFFLPHSLP